MIHYIGKENFCPQPDGRLITIRVEGGDQLTVAGVTDVLATYVRSVLCTGVEVPKNASDLIP